MYNAHFVRTSEKTANLLFSGPGIDSVLVTDIVSCPRLMTDQRGLELDLLCQQYGVKTSEVQITGIPTPDGYEFNHELNWVKCQANEWRKYLRKNIREYEQRQASESNRNR
jgi:hypothetical protein